MQDGCTDAKRELRRELEQMQPGAQMRGVELARVRKGGFIRTERQRQTHRQRESESGLKKKKKER